MISVDKRLTYSDVNEALDGKGKIEDKHNDFIQVFRDMAVLVEKLKEKRYKRGALDFDLAEAKVKLDDRGNPWK